MSCQRVKFTFNPKLTTIIDLIFIDLRDWWRSAYNFGMTKTLVSEHLKSFPPTQRKALETLREQIAQEIPEAKQVIKYGIPTFVIDGVPIIGFNGYKKHNSIFPYSGSVTSKLKVELANYDQTKGSIHFSIDKPFPRSLLKKVLKAKFVQLAER